MTGEATRLASVALRDKLAVIAAESMQADIRDIEFRDGRTVHSGSGASISFAELVTASGEAMVSGEGRYDTKHMNYPYGVHAAVVAIDRDTGIAKVEKFMIAYDIGCAINPLLVEGQLQGGLAQIAGHCSKNLFMTLLDSLFIYIRRLHNAWSIEAPEAKFF